ncbi:hypothetical protein LOK49_LG09G00614 [Camellia lanceoleosa]|uniref:Uncharacterized protein n=1 Tax=Camellia lanceoleosa TaxID=1840588 RepID=A0ACC0GIP2_9ERIC|nr:hypothetical protein LOK49_LG09G00614 [Camellia lanceoleosa]
MFKEKNFAPLPIIHPITSFHILLSQGSFVWCAALYKNLGNIVLYYVKNFLLNNMVEFVCSGQEFKRCCPYISTAISMLFYSCCKSCN